MARIENDKYYTSNSIAKHCIDIISEVIGFDNISEVIEPSAGNGVFLKYLTKTYFAFDIEPENENIKQQDFLTTDIKYLEGRLILTNPPYGRCLNMAQKFFKKSIEMAEYIAFILPISQLNNTNSFYEFDLIYSEDLGKQLYTDRYLHCCFNIYKKPEYTNNKKSSSKLNDIEIIRQDSKKYKDSEYDLRFCYWGDGTAGKIIEDNKQYAGEYKIIIKNLELKDKILNVFRNYDWKTEINRISMRRIKQWQLIKVLREEIPEIN